MKALVTGATGFIGKHLLRTLAERGDEITILARSPDKASRLPGHPRAFRWAGEAERPPEEAFAGIDAIFHLAGEPVNGRFTEEHKRRVYDSRVLGTRRLVETLAALNERPKVLVSATAVGYYGDRGNEVLTESSTPGDGFLSHVCKDWEREALAAEALGIHVSRVRIGIVLGRDGGALKEMLPPFKAGVGGPLAGGKSWMPWIHIDDLVALLLHAARPGSAPVYNGCTPNPATNKELTKALGKVLKRPTVFPVPKVALQTLFGKEMAEVILMSDRAVPAQAEKEHFVYRFPTLEPALRDILG